MTFLADSAILATKPGIKILLILPALCLSGCMGSFHVRENVSESQIKEISLIRKPMGEKSWGLLPRYEDFLEGYIVGGLVAAEGKPVEGVTVRVTDDQGTDLPQFSQGVSDNQGIYRIRFSLPIRWERIDFAGNLKATTGWQIAAPKTKFKIYLNRGILAYLPQESWLPVKNEIVQTKPAFKMPSKQEEKNPPKKKPGDPFEDFNFGQ